MELKNFLDILRKHKYPLMIIPIVVMIIAFIIVKNKPNEYYSKARISAGLVDQTQKIFLDKEDQGENKVNQSFSNLIQMLQLKTVIDQVSYQLILNDLTTSNPFKQPSKLLADLTPSARKHAVEVYTKMYNSHQPLSMVDPDQKGLFKVLASMGYDCESIKKYYHVYRVETSDFIDLDFTSGNPLLSAFVVNSISKEFITYYTQLTKQNELKALNFVSDELKTKKDSLDIKTEDLMNYKIKNRILNLNEETKSLYNQLSDFETRLQLAENEVHSNTGAIEGIDKKFSQNERQYMESRMSLVNRDIVRAKEKLSAMNDEYIRSNFSPAIKVRIDSMRDALGSKLIQSTDKYISNPLMTKDNLLAQKMKLEIDLSLSENSIKYLRNQIETINQRLDSLVPNEAEIQSKEADINVASQEYLEILKKFNQVSLEFNSAIRIKQIEAGSPDDPLPSKKIVIVILSGLITAVLYFIILFVLFYLDNTIKVPENFEKATDMRVLGFFPVVKSSFLEIQRLWDRDSVNDVDREFRNLLRSTRFELHMALKDRKILAVTSLGNGAGKTLCALSLASAYHMIGKKVLLIDGNFINPEITRIGDAADYVEDFLADEIAMERPAYENKLRILGNKGADTTLFEINNEDWIRQKLNNLKASYDIIIIETSSLDTLNESKEWIEVSDSVLAVFEANKTITHEMKEKIEYLRGIEGKLVGWVLNKVTNINYKITESKKAL